MSTNRDVALEVGDLLTVDPSNIRSSTDKQISAVLRLHQISEGIDRIVNCLNYVSVWMPRNSKELQDAHEMISTLSSSVLPKMKTSVEYGSKRLAPVGGVKYLAQRTSADRKRNERNEVQKSNCRKRARGRNVQEKPEPLTSIKLFDHQLSEPKDGTIVRRSLSQLDSNDAN
jgi:hypothetical protein